MNLNNWDKFSKHIVLGLLVAAVVALVIMFLLLQVDDG